MWTRKQAEELLEKLASSPETLNIFDNFNDELRKVAVMEVIEMKKGQLDHLLQLLHQQVFQRVHVCAKLIQQGIIPRIPVSQQLSMSVAKKN